MNKIINGRFFSCSFIITNFTYASMIFWSLPQLLKYSKGLNIFDMRPFGYSLPESMALLHQLGTKGLLFYQKVQLPIDTLYPLGFIITYSIGCLWIFRKIDLLKPLGLFGALSSIIGGVLDSIENILIYKIINTYPQVPEDLIAKASNVTMTKTLFCTMGLSTFLIGVIIFIFLRIKKWQRV